jgi:SAM-dependent methyltransferase
MHVVRDVGDGDDQAEALALADRHRFAVHRIVEVAGVFAVDRDERHIAQVDAMADVCGTHFVRQPRGVVQRGLAELVRHAVLAHGDFDFHARVVDIAQHFHDAAERLRMAAREIRQFDHHHLADLRLLGVLRDQNVVADALVFRRDDQGAVLVEQAADHALVGAVRDFDDMAFGSATPVIANDPREHAVVVHDLLHLAGGQEQVVLAVVAHEKPVAVAVALHAAADEIGGMRKLVMIALIEPDLAIALHCRQTLEKSFALLALDRQGFGDVVRCKRRFTRA